MKKLIPIIFIFSFLLFSCSNPTEPKEKSYSVKYEVTGSAKKVSITIENDNGGTSQFSDVSVPWTYNFADRKKEGTFVYVAAQNQGETGTVTTTIYKDGKVFKTSTSSGAYVIATASGML